MPFLHYAIQGFLDGIRDQIDRTKRHQLEIAWENYVHNEFKNKKSTPTQKRRRDLVLELSKHEWVKRQDLEELSPHIARLYATSGERMMQRDLNAISKMRLIERSRGRVRARKEVTQAFLAARMRRQKAK